MKIAYIFNHASIVGGGEISFIDLILSAGSLGIEPVVFVPGKGDVAARLRSAGMEVHEIAQPRINWKIIAGSSKPVRDLTAAFRKHDIAIVHTNGARCMLYAGMAARKAGVPCIWHVRVLERDFLLDRYRAFLATRIIANSKAVAARLKHYTMSPSKITVVYNGIDIGRYREIRAADISQDFGLPEAPVVLAAGRLSPEKGYECLIRACAVLNQKKRRFVCLIAGQVPDGRKSYQESLAALAQELDVKNISFAGWRNDIPSLMKASVMVVLPSLRESFGRIVIEAWASGVPIVAASGGGPGEIITHGRDGLLSRPNDPESLAGEMEKMLADPGLRARLAAGGAKSVMGFTLEQHAESVLAMYQSLISLEAG